MGLGYDDPLLHWPVPLARVEEVCALECEWPARAGPGSTSLTILVPSRSPPRELRLAPLERGHPPIIWASVTSALRATRSSAIFRRTVPARSVARCIASGEVRRTALRTRPTPSWTAPRCRKSSPYGAAELGYEALALTDHDGVYGSLEFAHAAKAFGVRAITGAEVTLERGAHVTLLVENARGYANLCRLLTAAHAGTRPRPEDPPLDPALPSSVLLELNDGLVCLSGCARHGLGVRDPNTAAAVAGGFPRALLRRAAAAVRARRRAQERRAARPRRDAARADGRDRRRARAPSRAARSCRTCSSRSANARRSTARSPSGAATTSPSCSRRRDVLERFPDDRDAVARAGELADRLRFDLTADLGYTLPRLRRRRAGEREAQARLRPRVRRALLRLQRTQAKRARAARRRARADRPARPRRVLPAPPRGAPAGRRLRARGARRRRVAARAAARPRTRLVGRLDRLLPDRPLARRPGRPQGSRSAAS